MEVKVLCTLIYFETVFRGRGRSTSEGEIGIHSCYKSLTSFKIECFYSLRKRIYEYVPHLQLLIINRSLTVFIGQFAMLDDLPDLA